MPFAVTSHLCPPIRGLPCPPPLACFHALHAPGPPGHGRLPGGDHPAPSEAMDQFKTEFEPGPERKAPSEPFIHGVPLGAGLFTACLRVQGHGGFAAIAQGASAKFIR